MHVCLELNLIMFNGAYSHASGHKMLLQSYLKSLRLVVWFTYLKVGFIRREPEQNLSLFYIPGLASI